MGVSQSALVSFPKDHRIEKCIKVFASKWVLKLHRWVVDHNQPILGSIVPEEKLDELWILFLRYDRDKKGMIVSCNVILHQRH